MDFKNILSALSQLSEATEETPTGRIHKAEPGGYGRKFDTDEEGDEKKDDKKPQAPKKRGRPSGTGEYSQSPEEKKKAKSREEAGKRLQDVMVGKAPKKPIGKVSAKHSLKEWVQEIEEKYVAEAVPPGIKPLAILDPKNQQAGAGVLTSKNPAVQKMLGSIDPKDVQIVQTTQGTSTTKPTAGATGQAPVGQQPVQEKWAGDAKVKATGEYSGKSKEELKSMLSRLHKSGPHKRGSPEEKRMHQINFALRAKGGWKKGEGAASKQEMSEGDIPSQSGVDTRGAGLGAGRSDTTLEAKKAKPDFLDIDKDGNKKESMKKAAKDKKKVDESMNTLEAAYHEGKSHGLSKHSYACKYDEGTDEHHHYHRGFVEGLDECYGMRNEPIIGMEENVPATVPGMADSAMDEGNAFTKALATTPKGGKFSVGGKTFTDRTSYDAPVNEFAFEGWDKELNNLLSEGERVDEGMSVSISKGQQGAPDSVSVTAQDGDADALLGLIKHAGLGLFNDEANHIGAGADDQLQKQGGIDVVGDHDGMMSLIKKVTGGEEDNDQDYEDEEGSSEDHAGDTVEVHGSMDKEGAKQFADNFPDGEEDHEHVDEEKCNKCGCAEDKCQCEKEQVEEVESSDQMSYEVAEDSDESCDIDEKEVDESVHLEEWANQIGKGEGKGTDAQFEQDIEFMTRVISGGLNKPKSTGQTTVPVVSGQELRTEDPLSWARLAGIKK